MTRYFYDTEFIEDGRTIDLISIGIVADDGREYYAVSCEFDHRALNSRPWLVEHVRPSLPSCPCGGPDEWHLNIAHPDVRWRVRIQREVAAFLTDAGGPTELWADYGAYDHVALCQLFGSMIDLPDGVPMWTNDLRQELARHRNPAMPVQDDGEHNALADARHLKVMFDALTRIESGG